MRDEKLSIKEVYEKFLNLESEKKLIHLEIHGVKFWQVVRYDLFNIIIIKLGLYGQAHTLKKTSFDKLKAMPIYLYNTITKNPFIGKKSINTLIFDHERKILVDNNYIDIYTHDFIKGLSLNDYEVIENDYLRKHWTKRNMPNRKYNDFYYISTLLKRVFNKNILLTEEEKRIIKEVNKEIKKLFKIELPLEQYILDELEKFKLQFDYYLKLLKVKKPKTIILVVSYGRQPLIGAAKKLGIEVIEIQHGVITPYHLGYHYPNQHFVDYFPNKLLLFGEFWKNAAEFPIPIENTIPYGFPYLQKRLEKYKGVPKTKKQILVLSQGTIGKELSEFIYKTAKNLKNYTIIYKLHPGEFQRWKEIYPALVKARQLQNIKIIDSYDETLYSLMAESEIQIGVYSTAIFEGIVLNCKTILVNLPGIEYMEILMQDKEILVIDPKTSISEKDLGNLKDIYFKDDYFFKGTN